MSIFDFSECKLVWCAVLCVGVVSSLTMWQQRLVTVEADLAVTQLIIIPAELLFQPASTEPGTELG